MVACRAVMKERDVEGETCSRGRIPDRRFLTFVRVAESRPEEFIRIAGEVDLGGQDEKFDFS